MHVSDGTVESTKRLESVFPSYFVEFQDRLYFSASDGFNTFLWTILTIGFANEIYELQYIGPYLTTYDEMLWCVGSTAQIGIEVHSYDLASNDLDYYEVNPGSDWSNPRDLTGTTYGLFFIAESNSIGRELHYLKQIVDNDMDGFLKMRIVMILMHLLILIR